jgi:intracellular sulfur oxidation DsrE/DsrF family protein
MVTNNKMSSAVILMSRDGLGNAEPDLMQKLVVTYFQLLLDNGDLPAAICFYTNGVKLTVEGSPVLEQLAALEARGVRLIVCTTCLNYFGLMDKLKVGIAGGMGDILSAQINAEKVITL